MFVLALSARLIQRLLGGGFVVLSLRGGSPWCMCISSHPYIYRFARVRTFRVCREDIVGVCTRFTRGESPGLLGARLGREL